MKPAIACAILAFPGTSEAREPYPPEPHILGFFGLDTQLRFSYIQLIQKRIIINPFTSPWAGGRFSRHISVTFSEKRGGAMKGGFARTWTGRGALILWLAIAAFPPLTGGAMGSAEEQERISIKVDQGALGPGLPSEDRIRTVGRELLISLFPEDVRRSQSVRGQITRIDGPQPQFELMSLFLFKETYTAVTHRVVFTLSGEKAAVLNVE